jgi:protein-L-isoaspartate(D-aspartate) O-methyltransferase
MEIPLSHGEKMLAPRIEARMLQALAVKPTDRILEIGTGSGYMTALLAKLGAHLRSVDIVPEFSAAAALKLKAHGIANTTLEVGDAARGWNVHAPYDVIVLTGSVPLLPDTFQKGLAGGGRLLAVVGDPPAMEARLVTCAAPGTYSSLALFETCIPPLKNALQPERFVF